MAGPAKKTVTVPLALPVSGGPGIGGVSAVEFVAETVNEYVPGQYNPGTSVVPIDSVELPAPVPVPGGVETGLDEKEYDVPEGRPERPKE
jgi:hypothetical protein